MFFLNRKKKTFLKKDVERRKMAKMLCFEAPQKQSLGEGAAQKSLKEQIPRSQAYSSPRTLWKEILQHLNPFAENQHLEKLTK